MSDVSGLRTARTPQPSPERVEPAGSAPTPLYGAPSLGAPDRSWGITPAHIAAQLARLDPDNGNERVWFPIHADRAFGEGPEAGQ